MLLGEPDFPPLPGEPFLGERLGEGVRLLFLFEGGVGVRGGRLLEPEDERDFPRPPGDAERLGDFTGRFVGNVPGAAGAPAGDLRPECI